MDYKLGQVLGITNRGKRDYKQGQLNRFQIGAKRLKIGAEITNWCRTTLYSYMYLFMYIYNIYSHDSMYMLRKEFEFQKLRKQKKCKLLTSSPYFYKIPDKLLDEYL